MTSQFIPNNNDSITPKAFVDIFIENLKKSVTNPIIKYHEQKPDSILFEFRVENPENQKQDELQLVRKTKDGFYILHYVIKKSDMSNENREKWLNLLKQSEIVD